mgnify:FL=1|tara:strand:+ start:918 stop:1244 length:327 start_codon:yes stop_codon:yes gene_type:complete
MKKYIFILTLVLLTFSVNAQVTAIHFNADWNDANKVEWFGKLSDVEKDNMDISEGDCQKKYKIAVVPTIIVFDDGEEVKRFQADLSFKIQATRNEVQDYIDELLMSKF